MFSPQCKDDLNMTYLWPILVQNKQSYGKCFQLCDFLASITSPPHVCPTVHLCLYIKLYLTLLRHSMTSSIDASMQASESQKCEMLGRRGLPTHPHPTNSSAFYGRLNSRGSIYHISGKSRPLFFPLFYLLPKILRNSLFETLDLDLN